jgi:hypothetical protein
VDLKSLKSLYVYLYLPFAVTNQNMSQKIAAEQAIVDRRQLLSWMLADLHSRGRTVLLPVGCNENDYDAWLLDALNVDRLLRQIGSGGNVDLVSAFVPTNQTANAPHTSTSKTKSLEEIAHEVTHAMDSHLPHLSSKSLQIALTEDELGEIAYAVFIAACSNSVQQLSPNLHQCLRAQLALTEVHADEIIRTVSVANNQGVTSLALLDAHVRLLQVVRPSSFDTFRNFVRWRNIVTSTVWLVLSHGARDLWIGDSSTSSSSTSAKSLLAKLKGGLRRLDVNDPDEFDEEEYSQAATAVHQAAEEIAKRCSSGWGFSSGLRIRLAEMLLRAAFDALEEGQYSEAAEELLSVLGKCVWSDLGIDAQTHAALYAWSHFRQYMGSGNVEMLEASRKIIATASFSSSQMNTSTGGGCGSGIVSIVGQDEEGQKGDDETDTGGVPPPSILGYTTTTIPTSSSSSSSSTLALDVLSCLSDELYKMLSDYRRTIVDPRHLKAAIALLADIEASRGREECMPDIISSCISSSLEHAFDRKAQDLEKTQQLEEDRITLLAAATSEFLRSEFNEYSPLILPHYPAARKTAARTLHGLFGSRMLPWLVGVGALNKSALEAIRASITLEDALVSECKEQPPTPWGTMERLSPLLYNWAQGQTATLSSWVDRILKQEDWSRASNQRAGTSRSVTETVKMCHETLETLFDMKLSIPPGVVRCLVEGVDAALQRYCDFIEKDVGSADVMVPPPPPLTRYKKDVVAEVQAMETRAALEAQGVNFNQHDDATGSNNNNGKKLGLKGVKTKIESALTASQWLPPMSPDQMTILMLSYDSLIVRANSVQHLCDCLPALEHLILDKWEEARPETVRKQGGDRAYDWVQGIFNATKKSALTTAECLCNFIGMKLIFGGMRDIIFERLYRFHVSSARLEFVLQEVDRNLGELCSRAHDALPPHLARAIASALVAAIKFVLLDGGPWRLYTLGDIDMLESDLAQLRATFYCGGEGIPLDQIDAICRPVSDLIDVMQLDTGIIISNLKSAGGAAGRSASRRLSGNGGGPLAMNPDVMLKVLCHRADHAASKYLKKEYKIPKRLPLIVTQSVQSSIENFGKSLSPSGKK